MPKRLRLARDTDAIPIRERTCHNLIQYRRLSVKRVRQDGTLVLDQSEGLDRQQWKNESYAKRHGHTIAFDEVDDGKSAYDLEVTRDAFERGLTLVQSGQADGIIASHEDRLNRQPEDALRIMKVADAAGVPVIANGRVYDMSDGQDSFAYLQASGLAKQQSDEARRRILEEKDEARRDGNLRRVYGGPPRYGWRNTPAKWVVDNEQADVLREIAARLLAVDGETLGALYAEKSPLYPHTNGEAMGKPLTYKALRNVLLVPVTAGLMVDRDGEVMGKVADGPLDRETWEELQTHFAARKRGRTTTDAYPLGKLLRCGKCGNQLTGEPMRLRDGTTVPIYACANPHKGLADRPCRGTQIQVEVVHQAIRDGLAEWTKRSPRAKRIARMKLDSTGKRAKLEVARATWRDRLDQATDKRDNEDFTQAQYEKHEARCLAKLAQIKSELAALREVERNPVPVNPDFDSLRPERKRQLVEEVFATPIRILPQSETGGRNQEDRMAELRLRD